MNTSQDFITLQLRAISKFASKLIELTNREELIWFTAHEVVGQAGFIDCVIYLLDAEKQRLVQTAAVGKKINKTFEIINYMEIPLGKGISGHVATTGKPLIVNDLSKDDRYIPDMEIMQSEMCVPILHGEKIYGVIDCEHPEKNFFQPHHIQSITTIANMLASKLAQAEATENLQISEQNLRKVQRIAGVGDWQWHIQKNTFYISPEMLELLHIYDQKKYLSLSQFLSLLTRQDRGHFKMALRKFFKDVTPFQIDLGITGQDGKKRYITVQGEANEKVNGKITSIIGTAIDITGRVHSEQVLKKALQEAQKANQSKSDFLANMSHELRTPLNAIIGLSEVMSKEIFGKIHNPKYKEYSENIHTAGEYLLTIISNILDISAIEDQKLKPVIKPINLPTLLSQVQSIILPMAKEKNITCLFDFSDYGAPFMADETHIKQILINLLNNSVKFTAPKGTIQLNITKEDSVHLITICDTGRGISSEKLSTIRERFNRGEIDPMVAIEGTGLGLSIVEGLVHLHGGTLDIVSKVGKGTTIEVRLPVRT